MNLGQIVKSAMVDDPQIMESREEFPLDSFMANKVRFQTDSCLDSLDVYIKGFEHTIDKYSVSDKPNAYYLSTKRKELNNLKSISKKLRKDKVELWLHVMPYVREYIRKYGEVGIIRINMPINTSSTKVMNIDFVNNKMIIWK